MLEIPIPDHGTRVLAPAGESPAAVLGLALALSGLVLHYVIRLYPQTTRPHDPASLKGEQAA